MAPPVGPGSGGFIPGVPFFDFHLKNQFPNPELSSLVDGVSDLDKQYFYGYGALGSKYNPSLFTNDYNNWVWKQQYIDPIVQDAFAQSQAILGAGPNPPPGVPPVQPGTFGPYGPVTPYGPQYSPTSVMA